MSCELLQASKSLCCNLIVGSPGGGCLKAGPRIDLDSLCWVRSYGVQERFERCNRYAIGDGRSFGGDRERKPDDLASCVGERCTWNLHDQGSTQGSRHLADVCPSRRCPP